MAELLRCTRNLQGNESLEETMTRRYDNEFGEIDIVKQKETKRNLCKLMGNLMLLFPPLSLARSLSIYLSISRQRILIEEINSFFILFFQITLHFEARAYIVDEFTFKARVSIKRECFVSFIKRMANTRLNAPRLRE